MVNQPTTDNPSPQLQGILAVIGAIGIVIMLGGSLYIGIQGFEAAKIMVPPDILKSVLSEVVTVMKTTMEEVGKQVQATPTPIDDAIWSAGQIPVSALIDELSKRTMSPEDRLKAIEALQGTQPVSVGGDGGIGQGIGASVSPFIKD